MKQKIWIKLRVFISFSLFIIFVINIFSFVLYFFTIQTFRNNLEKDILNQAWIIKTFINLNKNKFISLPNSQIEKINNLWLYFSIWKNNTQNNYLKWIKLYQKELIYKEYYNWYNIIVWKNISDLIWLKQNFIKIILLLNIISIFFTILFSYIITDQVLKPLKKLSDYFSKFDIYSPKKLKIENYWNSEIGKLYKSINKFTKDIKNIFKWQKNFIQDTSHELKTPLMQIETSLSLLENKLSLKKDKIKLYQIRNSINNMNEIISNISFILRWNEKILENNKINIYEYLKNFTKNYNILCQNKNIQIIINCIYNFELITNSYYLDRLFWNIISNAINYNKWNNKLKIIINNKNITIIDQWIWIKKEDLKLIFNRFYRSSNSKIYSKEWTWLWLSIVKKITHMFWWKIIIESEENIWTKIHIIFE